MTTQRILVQISFADSVNLPTLKLENPVKMQVSKSDVDEIRVSAPKKNKQGREETKRGGTEGFFPRVTSPTVAVLVWCRVIIPVMSH